MVRNFKLLAKIGAVQPESIGDTNTKTLLFKIKSTTHYASLRGLKIQIEWIPSDGFSSTEYVYPVFPGREGVTSQISKPGEESSLIILTTALDGRSLTKYV